MCTKRRSVGSYAVQGVARRGTRHAMLCYAACWQVAVRGIATVELQDGGRAKAEQGK
jgi:hypothetical protein